MTPQKTRDLNFLKIYTGKSFIHPSEGRMKGEIEKNSRIQGTKYWVFRLFLYYQVFKIRVYVALRPTLTYHDLPNYALPNYGLQFTLKDKMKKFFSKN